MSELTFSQGERRSYLVPALIAFVLLAIGAGVFFFRTPMRMADVTVTHVAVVPEHTIYKTDSKLVGHQDEAQDDFYVLATVRIDNHLKVPLFISDLAGSIIGPDDTATDTTAVQKSDLDNVYTAFPAIKPLASAPLLRESTVAPGDHAEGMVLLHYSITQADWDQRKSATVTVGFYHQGSVTGTIPK